MQLIQLILGLQMWINMKPYINQLYGSTALKYTVGISGPASFVDQKRNAIRIRPGQQTMIKVLPRPFETTKDFGFLEVKDRHCKLSHETSGLEYLTKYSRVGCETDCAMKRAISVCKCIPWHQPNDYKVHPICEMFGGYCFDQEMSDVVNYNYCKYQCLRDCDETEYIVIENVFPVDYKKVCRKGSFQDKQFKHNFQQHFAFHNYKILVERSLIPDLARSYENGSLCEEYVQKYVGFVNVYSPTATVILTKRDKAVFLYDQIGTIGGTFGLFIGMSMLSFAEVAMLMVSIGYQTWQICRNPERFVESDDLLSFFNVRSPNHNSWIQKMEGAIHVRISYDSIVVKSMNSHVMYLYFRF